MLNGAVTLGTYDGANIEIAQQAGEENNYIFGAKVEDIAQIAETYDPEKILAENPRIRRVVETLIDGTFSDGGNGMFQELYTALTKGASWHKPDHYYLLLDFIPYCEARSVPTGTGAIRRNLRKNACLMWPMPGSSPATGPFASMPRKSGAYKEYNKQRGCLEASPSFP